MALVILSFVLTVALAISIKVGFSFIKEAQEWQERCLTIEANYKVLTEATGLSVFNFDDHRGRRVVYKGNDRLQEVIVEKVTTSTPKAAIVEVDNVTNAKFSYGY